MEASDPPMSAERAEWRESVDDVPLIDQFTHGYLVTGEGQRHYLPLDLIKAIVADHAKAQDRDRLALEYFGDTEAFRDILAHLLELEGAWRIGSLVERDGKGGTRSNRNYDLARRLENVLRNRASLLTAEAGGRE